ncbi:MAG: ABC transporter ATP-binding protein [Candidatus Promineifilaceae bacterium]
MSDFAIETEQLRKDFGRKTAVAGLTLSVKRGEVFGFLGPNGAGKTTSIKMLLDLITPTSGSATLLGDPIGTRSTRAKVGYLPEHFRFYPWLKGEEFLDLHGKLYQMSAADRKRKIPQLLERVGLANDKDKKLEAYSKGMTQRIGLAQALMNEPELVILDEPTSGLDPMGRRLVRNIIGELRAQGTSVFVNSHLLSEIEKTCDRVAFIRNGKVLEVHTLADFANTLQVKLRLNAVTTPLITHLNEIGTNVQAIDDQQISCDLSTGELIPTLAKWLINNGYDLYELTPLRQSLEDRFIEVVENKIE